MARIKKNIKDCEKKVKNTISSVAKRKEENDKQQEEIIERFKYNYDTIYKIFFKKCVERQTWKKIVDEVPELKLLQSNTLRIWCSRNYNKMYLLYNFKFLFIFLFFFLFFFLLIFKYLVLKKCIMNMINQESGQCFEIQMKFKLMF